MHPPRSCSLKGLFFCGGRVAKIWKHEYECWKTRGGKPVVIMCSEFMIASSYVSVWWVCLEVFENVSSNIHLKRIHVTYIFLVSFICSIMYILYTYVPCLYYLHTAVGCQMKEWSTNFQSDHPIIWLHWLIRFTDFLPKHQTRGCIGSPKMQLPVISFDRHGSVATNLHMMNFDHIFLPSTLLSRWRGGHRGGPGCQWGKWGLCFLCCPTFFFPHLKISCWCFIFAGQPWLWGVPAVPAA